MRPNLLIWTTDWHLVPTDTDNGVVDETKPYEAAAVIAHLAGLEPAGMIDTGDCKDSYVTGSLNLAAEYDQYIAKVRSRAPWLPVNAVPGINAPFPILPGNHDEQDDYATVGGETDFTTWDTKMWPAPYHWTADWAAPQIRIIALHASVIHKDESTFFSFFKIDQSEVDYLTAQLALLPAGWKAFVVTHPPIAPALGNQIADSFGGTALRTAIANNAGKIVACLCGHRHVDNTSTVLSGVTHISGGSMAYTLSNSQGSWNIIEWRPGTSDFKFHLRFGPSDSSLFAPRPVSIYTPIVIPR